MSTDIFQNIDLPSSNPLQSSEPKKQHFLNKKIIVLGSLVILIFILFIVALILQQKPNSTKIIQTLAPSPTITPTPVLENNLPNNPDQILNQMNIYLNDDRRFLPPAIDPNLGFQK